jgi:hypothetical protein
VSHDRSVTPGWHHIVASAGPESVDLWVDGAHHGRKRSGGAPDGVLDEGRLSVGSGGHSPFSGAMRNLRIYDRALSARDVAALGAEDDPRRTS